MLEFPATVAKCANIADGTHWDVDQACGISERLRGLLGLHNSFEHTGSRHRSLLAIWVCRIFGTHPGKSGFEQHPLHIGTPGEPVAKAAGRTKARRRNAESSLHRGRTKLNVIPNYLRGSPPLNEPGGALKTKLNILRPSCQDEDVVIG